MKSLMHAVGAISNPPWESAEPKCSSSVLAQVTPDVLDAAVTGQNGSMSD